MATQKPAAKAAKSKKVTAKAAEETKKLPKNPNEFSYRGDEELIIKASDFLALAEAIEIAVNKGVKTDFPQRFKYIASATGIDVTNPTQEEIRTGAVRAMMDVEQTFEAGNAAQTYEAWLVPKVIDAKTKIFQIHAQNVEAGKAVKYDVLQKEAQELQEVQRQAAEAKEATEKPESEA